MAENKPTIHEFNPEIYPVRFWVVIDTPPTELGNSFSHIDGSEYRYKDTIPATAFIYSEPLKLKSSGKYGFMLCVVDKEDFDLSAIAHEATHLAGCLWNWVGEKEIKTENEANAYLVGWFVRCIHEALND